MKLIFKGNKHFRVFQLNRSGNVTTRSVDNNSSSVETRYRYFMIAVKALDYDKYMSPSEDDSNTIQFCKLRFYTGDNPNDCYQWCNKMISFDDMSDYVEGIKWSGTTGSSGEELLKGLWGMGGPDTGKDHDEVEGQSGTYYQYGKICYKEIFDHSIDEIIIDPASEEEIEYHKYEIIKGEKCACFAWDIDKQNLGRRINISFFNKWCWYSANDTASYYVRNMIKFDLYMSNDRKNWQLVDTADIEQSTLPHTNFEMMYHNSIEPLYTIEEGKKIYTKITLEI